MPGARRYYMAQRWEERRVGTDGTTTPAPHPTGRADLLRRLLAGLVTHGRALVAQLHLRDVIEDAGTLLREGVARAERLAAQSMTNCFLPGSYACRQHRRRGGGYPATSHVLLRK